MAGPPPSARSFFKDPRSFVEQCADGQKVLRLRTGPSRFTLVRDPDEIGQLGCARPGGMLDGSAVGAKEKPSATTS